MKKRKLSLDREVLTGNSDSVQLEGGTEGDETVILMSLASKWWLACLTIAVSQYFGCTNGCGGGGTGTASCQTCTTIGSNQGSSPCC